MFNSLCTESVVVFSCSFTALQTPGRVKGTHSCSRREPADEGSEAWIAPQMSRAQFVPMSATELAMGAGKWGCGVSSLLHSVECTGEPGACFPSIPFKSPERQSVVSTQSSWFSAGQTWWPCQCVSGGSRRPLHTKDRAILVWLDAFSIILSQVQRNWVFLAPWGASDKGHSKEILIVTATGYLSKGIDGSG